MEGKKHWLNDSKLWTCSTCELWVHKLAFFDNIAIFSTFHITDLSFSLVPRIEIQAATNTLWFCSLNFTWQMVPGCKAFHWKGEWGRGSDSMVVHSYRRVWMCTSLYLFDTTILIKFFNVEYSHFTWRNLGIEYQDSILYQADLWFCIKNKIPNHTTDLFSMPHNDWK